MIRLIVYFHQVDDKKTIGPEAFARIAPACPVVADVIIVHNLFGALTSSSSHRLHFLIFDKYLRSLDKYEMFIDLCWFFKLQFFCIVENNVSIHVNLMGQYIFRFFKYTDILFHDASSHILWKFVRNSFSSWHFVNLPSIF